MAAVRQWKVPDCFISDERKLESSWSGRIFIKKYKRGGVGYKGHTVPCDYLKNRRVLGGREHD